MNQLSQEEKQRIINVLNSRNANGPCPRCGNRNFILADGYFNHPMQVDIRNINIGGPSIPTIATVCSNCGFVSEHALGVLGLLNNTDKND